MSQTRSTSHTDFVSPHFQAQTQDVLDIIDKLLARCGSDGVEQLCTLLQ